MGKRIAILQPGYLPWLGYFDQLAAVDLFVHYDDVQYTRRDWRNRNRVKGPDGAHWLTIPVASKGQYAVPINEVRVADHTWQTRHLRTIRHCYSRCRNFTELFPKLESWLREDWQLLADGCISGVSLLSAELGIHTPTLRSSRIEGIGSLSRSKRLIAICRQLGATEYLSGSAARAYLDVAAFEHAGIKVLFQDYEHPTYRQKWGDFLSHMSILDLLMNEGSSSLGILRSLPLVKPVGVM